MQKNSILSALVGSTAASVLEHGVLVGLALRQPIYEAEEPIKEVYFPLDCVLSVVANERREPDGGRNDWSRRDVCIPIVDGCIDHSERLLLSGARQGNQNSR